ncbi:MAG: tryptophan 2,3-dioxygenase, partial [Bacteroidota bacterium]
SLLPASGFQSAQFRKIEILSTNLVQLVHYTKREEFDVYSPIELMYPNLYWKSGATELATGKKTLTLKQFEQKYSNEFIWLAGEMREKNILQQYLHLPSEAQQDIALKEALRTFDFQANVLWPLSHYKSAVRYLDRKPDIIEATGGTNWQKYLPPKNQRIIFFPMLWNDEELEKWGRRIVL